MRSILIFGILIMMAACANRVTPTGGLKDELPPKVTEAIPANKTTLFKSGVIKLYFDEYVQLNDLAGQFLVSPLMNKMPEVKANKNEVIITLPDSLLANTTYTLNFGKSIVDVHESNPLADYQYVFSTGDFLDSLKLEGVVEDAAVLTGLKGITVLVYRNICGKSDSLPFKKRPDYFSRTNEHGEFRINNMSPGEYSVYALDDKNGNYICDSPQDESLAFMDSTVTLPGEKLITLLAATTEPATMRLVKYNKVDRNTVLIAFNKVADSVEVKNIDGSTPAVGNFYWTSFHDSLYFYREKNQDSIHLVFFDRGIAFDTLSISMNPAKGVKEPDQKLRLTIRRSPADGGPESGLVFVASHPLALAIDSATVSEDSSKALRLKLDIVDGSRGVFRLYYPWKSGGRYKVQLLPGAVTDIFGLTTDTFRLDFTVPTPEITAMLTVSTEGLHAGGNYLLQLMNDKFEMLRTISLTSDTTLTFSYLNAGSIKLRLINDLNHDGRWTYGNYLLRRQPEPVFVHPETLTLRSNWELDVTLKVPVLFTP